MSKTYRPYEPDKILLLPPSVKDWLPMGHLAHFISELVDESLDLKAITKVYEREELRQAEETDVREDAEYGADKRGD